MAANNFSLTIKKDIKMKLDDLTIGEAKKLATLFNTGSQVANVGWEIGVDAVPILGSLPRSKK